MAKTKQKQRARQLRHAGESIKDISEALSVSKGSVSLWCHDIQLSDKQVAALNDRKLNRVRLGQQKGAQVLKQRRLEKMQAYRLAGKKTFSSLTNKEFFAAGLALYIGEGAKKERAVKFFNSDPKIMRFMVRWFQKFYGIPNQTFTFTILANQIHKNRDEVMKSYWSTYLHMPTEQFRKTIFVTSKQNKRYENHDTYYGTLRFAILKSSDLFYRIQGLMNGLLEAGSR